MDTSQVGIEAARLMDELAELLPDEAELQHVTLVAAVTVPGEDAARDMHVYLRSSAESRLEQVGALTTATQMAIDAEPQ